MLFWVPEFTLRVPTRLSPYGNARGGGAFESSFLSKHASSPREASLWAKLSEWDEALVHPACCGTFSQPDEEMSVLNTFTLRVSAVALMVSTEFIKCPTIKVFFCFFLDNILHQLLLIFKILPWKLESRFFFSQIYSFQNFINYYLFLQFFSLSFQYPSILCSLTVTFYFPAFLLNVSTFGKTLFEG